MKHTQGELRVNPEIFDEKEERGVFVMEVISLTTSLSPAYIHGSTKEEVRANAERMVTAWNNHDELLEALKRACGFMELEVNSNMGINSQRYNKELDLMEQTISKARTYERLTQMKT